MSAFDVRNANFNMSDPARDGYVVTPNDGANLPTPARAMWAHAAGDIHFLTTFGTELTLPVSAGLVPWGASKVFATGTTVTVTAITK